MSVLIPTAGLRSPGHELRSLRVRSNRIAGCLGIFQLIADNLLLVMQSAREAAWRLRWSLRGAP